MGDSISANVNFDVLEKGIKDKIVSAKAYSSIYDTVSNVAKSAAHFPEANFTAVIPAKLEKGNFEHLIVQAGSVDISNLNTKVDPTNHFDYLQQEVIVSAKNLFSACENAVKTNPGLKKVIIMKQTPRYDTQKADPFSLKPVLSEIFNNTLTELWMTSKERNRIFVGNHNIGCTGSIRESRYRNIQTGAYDGIHLYGSSGRKAYTNSVINILKMAGMVDPDFDHSNCAQARYMAMQGGYNKSNTWANDKDVRKSQHGQKIWSESNRQRYEVPT